MSLTPETLTIYILDILFLVFASIAFYLSVKIVLGYDRNKNTPLQYDLEKKSYLASTIIKFIFLSRFLCLYFLFLPLIKFQIF